MEKGRGKGTDTLQTTNDFTRKEYIEREAALALAHEIYISEVQYSHRCIDPQDVIEIPAADVVPVVRGFWTRIDYQPCGHDYKCSECHDLNDRASRYCPNCGARMDGDGE